MASQFVRLWKPQGLGKTRVNLIKNWSKFTYSFCKLDHFIATEKIVLMVIIWSSLQKSVSKSTLKWFDEIITPCLFNGLPQIEAQGSVLVLLESITHLLSISDIQHTMICCYAECHYAEFCVLFLIILIVIMVSVITLNVFVLSASMLSVVA